MSNSFIFIFGHTLGWLLQVVSPTISSPVCQEQLVEAGKLVDRSVESCIQACLSATEDGELLKQVGLWICISLWFSTGQFFF